MKNACMIYFTTPSTDEAAKLIKELLEKKFISCGTIVNNCKSFFWWQDKIQESTEWLVWLKTCVSYRDQILEYLNKNHSYELPFTAVFYPSVSEEISNWLEKL